MADAVRNVTIVMSIQPGDMSAVKAAIKELNEMKGIYEDVGASVQKLNAEQQSLGKTQAESARQERELITIKKEEVEIDQKLNRDQIENTKKRVEAEQKIEADHVAKVERIRRPLREPRSVRPLREPDGTVPFLIGGGGSGPVKPPKTDLSEFSKDIEDKIDKDYEAFDKNEQKKTQTAKREAEKRANEAEKMFLKIRAAELKNAKEMREESEQASADMPKHWRNVGLNAGQAVASAARYISHMRMLKNVGGDTLESMAKQFMTIQSRIETIAASTSFFTNTGTMFSGLQTAGQAMEKILRQQQIMGREATLIQTATVGIGKAAQSALPFIAPLQLAFTAATAAVVAVDIGMDFLGDSTEKVAENASKFNSQLDETIKKLQVERDLLTEQNNLLETQWKIKQRVKGQDNITPSDIKTHQDRQRKQRENELEEEHNRRATEIFEGGLTEEQKAERAKLEEERRKLIDERKQAEATVHSITARGSHIGNREETARLATARRTVAYANHRLSEIEVEQDVDKRIAYYGTHAENVDIDNGQIVDFDKRMAEINRIEDPEKRKQLLRLYASSASAANEQLAEQQRQREQMAEDEKAKAEQAARDAEKIKREQEAERAMAINYSMEDSQWRVNDARQEMQNFQNAQTPEEKARAAREAQRLLQGQGGEQANLLTPELQAQLSLGAAADPAQVISMIDDASVYDQGEQTAHDQAVEAAMKAKQKAEAQSRAMLRLAESLQDTLEENQRQIDALQRAIENRDL